jgi:coenzyme F420-0:L-glutamate ligase/coenzyme F420-1:gamma-L-glutamate ligase
MRRLEIIALEGLGEVLEGDSIGKLVHQTCCRLGLSLGETDILVVAHKIVSKAEGRIVRLDEIRPSARALELSSELNNKDPRLLELILRESRRIIKMGRGTIVVETHRGFVCANAGVDLSNAGLGQAVQLPLDPDASAARIREEIRQLSGVAPGLIVSDSFGRPWRRGTTEVALGVAGFKPLADYRGQTDSYGFELKASVTAIADEIASAANLVMGKSDGLPLVLVRGYQIIKEKGGARELLRPEAEDLFRNF